ncbi:kynurenine 3-monooxygenase-like [Dysidea avara]|uniref:kynurenine 3-monooxygenase-like n=1 Tax=Dysidea avara TaxID=196820 RepID=UPI0033287C66
MESSRGPADVVVVGGGLVGPLQAIFLAKHGHRVRLYEARDDIRTNKQIGGRSINLALSVRGREALKAVGVEDIVMEKAIPMYGRMIHSIDGKQYSLAYGVGDQCIYSVDRRALNMLLLDEAEKCDNVELHFSHKLTRVHFSKDDKKSTLVFSEGKNEEKINTDFCFGCDGAYSAVRRQMDRQSGLDYSQEYIPHAYKELTIPADPNTNKYALEKNYLHIWPRQEFMLIALPNLDESFTVTLFMPRKIFAGLNTSDDILRFFEEHFPDVISKIGRERLVKDFLTNETGKLMSLKCWPHYIEEGALLLGDAAHAMVPFYGQGMNAGFEDCLVFSELLQQNGDLHKTARLYSEERYKDSYAICDLAMYNYLEMRSHVNNPMFLLRRQLDRYLHHLFPRHFIPLYTMVSFSRIRYSKVVERAAKQDKLVRRGIQTVALLGFGTVLSYLLYRYHQNITELIFTP